MHEANHRFWRWCKDKYPIYFNNCKVVELGSFNINGTVRDYFSGCDYLGVDWRPGPCVDLVSICHEAPLDAAAYDMVISASMLEHDPHWKQSLETMIRVLKPNGGLFLSWGGGRNGEHEVATAPDCKFHALPAVNVINTLRAGGMYVAHFFYETSFMGGDGEVCLVAFKCEGSVLTFNLLPEDLVVR